MINKKGGDNMKSYTWQEVSDWFLSQESMSPKKLQKLTYYFEAWGNALFNKSLINNTKFEAWVHGPVSPDLYVEYRDYRWNPIDKKGNNDEIFEESALDLLNSVWVTYGSMSANELEALTHQETPWNSARDGLDKFTSSTNEISTDAMRDYYYSIYNGD